MWIASAILLVSTSSSPVWSGSLDAVTDVPLHVGARIRVESPERLRFAFSAGVLPEAYVGLINAAVVASGGYDEDTAELVAASLKESLVMRAAAGWRPFARRGFFAEANLTHVSLGGDVQGEDVFVVATGAAPPATGSGREYSVQSTLVLVGAELGWEWRLKRGVALRASLGFASTISARTTVEPKFDPIAPLLVKRFTDESEAWLDDTYRTYVHPPVVGLSAGWSF